MMVRVKAFQMTAERRTDNIDWPDWLHRAWNEERGAPGSVYPTEEGDGSGRLTVVTPEGATSVGWGDWIVRDTEGGLRACRPDAFEAIYETRADPARSFVRLIVGAKLFEFASRQQ